MAECNITTPAGTRAAPIVALSMSAMRLHGLRDTILAQSDDLRTMIEAVDQRMRSAANDGGAA